MTINFNLGKVDYNNSGRRNCMATLELSWDGSRFSLRASIWNPRHTDIYMGGQCIEEVIAYFPHHPLAQRLAAIWREWHLNDMIAGSPAQEAWLAANPVTAVYPESHYTKACAALTAAGINPDPGYLHNGKPYAYGSAWLKRDIPADIAAELDNLVAGKGLLAA